MPRVPRQGEPVSARHISQVVRTSEAARIGSAPGTLTASGPLGTTVKAISRPALRAPTAPISRDPFQVIGPYLDGTDWKIRIHPGTLNGLTPVVGDITGSGGTSLTATPAPTITLATGENMVVLAIKVDLETHEILRRTVETREDSELAPITDTGARTRITFAPLAELAESGGGTWSKLIQSRNTNLTYDYGVVYVAST